MNYLQEHYPNYDCDIYGNVFKDGKPAKVFKSNKYKQVLLFDKEHKRRVCGVHTVIAMKYLNYYEGCAIHHKDEDTTNNCVDNLIILSRSEHSSLHSRHNEKFKTFWKGKPAWNRGMKMSEEFCRHCKESAIKRWHGGNEQ